LLFGSGGVLVGQALVTQTASVSEAAQDNSIT